MAGRCSRQLLGCTGVAAIILLLYSWGGQETGAIGSRPAEQEGLSLIASRNLMSRDSLSEQDASMTPYLSLPKTSVDALLQRATSRLLCRSNGRGTKNRLVSNYDTEAMESLAGMHSVGRSGYVVVASFHEQQTKAAENLFGLQCWGKQLSVSVVEPYSEKSHLVMPFDGTEKALLKYGDLFDVGVWQLLSVQHEFAPLASWDSFVAKAPRQLIVVRFKYLTVMQSKRRKDSKLSVTHMAVDGSFKEGCRNASPELQRKVAYLRGRHNFTLVRDVCFNFGNGDQLTLFQFNRHLYGGFEPGAVTVLMEEWRGFSYLNNGKRVGLSDACPSSASVMPQTYMWPSRRLICDARKYRQMFLKTSNYITLMVRTEKIVSLNDSQEYMSGCLRETLKQWRQMRSAHGVEKTFLSMDIGAHGSNSLAEKDFKYSPYLHLYEEFVREVLGPDASVRTWEETFEAVTSYQDSGYVGSLQKTVAAQARCVLLTGGGSFQKHARYMYERVAGKKKKCIRIVSECSRGL